eukprot:TRINITY_DN2548_c0_g2_i3.p1 TRINITY_DN2548_c0_g2~~TRINITY_DN2548_c0_g2_i3.p1  ORF type:complete len:1131 (-),score=131.89 TRINITY_DN2548_c0_g2_i3:175-3567(-)
MCDAQRNENAEGLEPNAKPARPSRLSRTSSRIRDEPKEASSWEFLLSGTTGGPCSFIVCTAIVVALAAVAIPKTNLNTNAEIYVYADVVTQIFFAHGRMVANPYFLKFSDGGKEPTRQTRSIPFLTITFLYEATGTKCPGDDCDLKSENLLTSQALKHISTFEEKVWTDPSFQKYCALVFSSRDENKSKCVPPRSILQPLSWSPAASKASDTLVVQGFDAACNASCGDCTGGYECASTAWSYVMKDSGAALVEMEPFLSSLCSSHSYNSLSKPALPVFACAGGGTDIISSGVPFLMSSFYLGAPLGGLDVAGTFDGLVKDFSKDLYKLYLDSARELEDASDGNLRAFMLSRFDDENKKQELMKDVILLGVSFVLVQVYMWFTLESLFVTMVGMTQVLFSVFPTIIIWSWIDDSGVTFVQALAVFMMLGIGADDVFVLFDAWRQAKDSTGAAEGETANVCDIFVVAYRRSFSAMLATTATTSIAFVTGVTIQIPVIRDFCIFAAIIVTVDFVLCITLFAAGVAFWERYMHGHSWGCCGSKPERGAFCQDGCCFGLTRMCWQKVTCHDSHSTKTGHALDRFINGPLWRFVNTAKIPLLIFWFIAAVLAVLSIVFLLEPSNSAPRSFGDHHHLKRGSDIRSEYFNIASWVDVSVVWGMDESVPVAKWTRDATGLKIAADVNLDGMGSAVSAAGQESILKLCKAVDVEPNRKCKTRECLVGGTPGKCELIKEADGISMQKDPLCRTGRYCIMEQVHEFVESNTTENFPVADLATTLRSVEFKNYMQARFRKLELQQGSAEVDRYRKKTGVHFADDGSIKYMWITFNATVSELDWSKFREAHDEWQSFVDTYARGTGAIQTSLIYTIMVFDRALMAAAKSSVAWAVAIAFGVLSLCTWNWILALYGLLNICYIMLIIVGMWPLLGFKLEVFTVIFLIMAVGLSVDYTVHLVHAYNECEGTREERVKKCLSSMGITVLSGAATSLLAAVPLFFCKGIFFFQFGVFVFQTIFLSMLLAVFNLPPLLLLFGPTGHTGDIHPFYWLTKKVEMALLKSSEPEVSRPSVVAPSELEQKGMKQPADIGPTAVVTSKLEEQVMEPHADAGPSVAPSDRDDTVMRPPVDAGPASGDEYESTFSI